jgi:hypothetical protein
MCADMKSTFIVVALFLTAGCGGQVSTPSQRWDELKLSHYDFELSRVCFCLPRSEVLKVTVAAGKIVELQDAATGAAVAQDEAPWARTIDGFFDLIEEAERKGAKVTVTWDETLGYPTDIAIDWVPRAADDEVRFHLELNPLLPL